MAWRACVLPPPPPMAPPYALRRRGWPPPPHALPCRIAIGSSRWIIIGLNNLSVINVIKGLLVIRTRWAI